MNESVSPEDNVWYRQFYVWLIIFLPACAVAASFATLYIAAKNAPEMAIDDYASIEAIADEQIGRDRKAGELGISATLNFDGTRVNAKLQANELEALPEQLTLRIHHSTTAQFDTSAKLNGTAGDYTGTIILPSGAYDVHIEDPARTWRLSTRIANKPTTIYLQAFGAAE